MLSETYEVIRLEASETPEGHIVNQGDFNTAVSEELSLEALNLVREQMPGISTASLPSGRGLLAAVRLAGAKLK